MYKTAIIFLTIAILSSPCFARDHRGSCRNQTYTIRDKSYRVKGYYRNGKIYNRNYKVEGYISPNGTIRNPDYKTRGYLEPENRNNGKFFGGKTKFFGDK